MPHCCHPALCCDGHHIYRRTFISPTVSATHSGTITQLKPKVRLSSMNVYVFTCICLKCLSMLSSIQLTHSNNSQENIYPCFSLHPGINVLHYPNNRKSLFKRLFSFSEKLFNCSTQPYQRKSRCPCQKTRILLTTLLYSFSLQNIHLLIVYHADVFWGSWATWNETLFGQSTFNWLFSNNELQYLWKIPHIAYRFSRRQRSRKGIKVINVLLLRNTIKYNGA